MTFKEVKELAKKMATQKGHTIKRFNGQGYYYTAICANCRAGLRVYKKALDAPRDIPFCCDGTIVARDTELSWTGVDYNWADGRALSEYCSR